MRVLFLLMSSGALALAACYPESNPEDELQTAAVGLEAFSTCDRVEAYLHDTATAELGHGMTTSALATAPHGYTRTNVQLPGVDEADFVKTDGKTIFVLSGQRLYAVRSWPAPQTKLLSTLPLYGQPRQLFLDEKGRLAVLSDVVSTYFTPTPMTMVTLIDAADPARLRIMRSFLLYGSYRGARRIGSSLRIAAYHAFRWPQGTPAIRAPTLEEWLPGNEIACTDFYRPTLALRLGLTTLATVNLDGPSIHRVGIFGDAEEIYSSKTSMYIAGDAAGFTYLHRFAFTDPYRAKYAGSGKVDGYLLDSFSMDEYQGALRVATTVEEMVSDPDGPRVESWARLTVLAVTDQRLVVVGILEPLGKEEQVTGVRFLGKRGFIATSGAEPIYAIDLREPTAPKITGQLNVRGDATYLQPLDANHLIATVVGERLELSLFDVTDPAAPIQTDSTPVGARFPWSEATYEHKAFSYFWLTRTLAVPVMSELRLFRVDTVAGIKPIGAIELSDLVRGEPYFSWQRFPVVRRSIMADSYVYAISDAGIRVARYYAPEFTVATVRFQLP